MRGFVLPTHPPAATCRPAGHIGVLTRLLGRVALWLEVRRQRRQLLAMGDRMLRDIGISRADAEREATRPFWDLPTAGRDPPPSSRDSSHRLARGADRGGLGRTGAAALRDDPQ